PIPSCSEARAGASDPAAASARTLPRLPAQSASMTFCELARAKINLSLAVLGRRADGYHELESAVTFASCADAVRLSPGRACRVRVSGPFARDILGENLLEKTLGLLGATGQRLRLGAVALEKVLPVAAGLGGGSSDAAALLRAVRRANPDHAG